MQSTHPYAQFNLRLIAATYEDSAINRNLKKNGLTNSNPVQWEAPGSRYFSL